MKGNEQTSNPGEPLPITPLIPWTKCCVGPESCSMLLCQSDWPVQRMICWLYAAMVFRRGVVRSMSRSEGAEAQGHVGEGQCAVVGMEECARRWAVDKCRI